MENRKFHPEEQDQNIQPDTDGYIVLQQLKTCHSEKLLENICNYCVSCQHCRLIPIVLLQVLFDLILYLPSTVFQL